MLCDGIERRTFPRAGHGVSAIVHTQSRNETELRFVSRHIGE